MRLSISIGLMLGALAFVGAQDTPQDVAPDVEKPIFICPLPRCRQCPSTQRRTAPGVGFALEIGYGTASIRNNDGTFEQVAYIPGSAEYIARMQYLATTSSERMHNGERLLPGVDEQDLRTMPALLWFHLKRYLNKLLLRPADSRFSPLADMANQLRKEVEKYLGKSITSAAISSPDRVRLTRVELGDIFDYIWMEDLVKDKGNPMFSELYSMSAALAGYGQGLCANYTNSYECYREEEFAPAPWTLQLDFSNHSLSGATGGMNTARRSSGYMTFVNTALGFSHQSRELNDADRILEASRVAGSRVLGDGSPRVPSANRRVRVGPAFYPGSEERFVSLDEDASTA
ncbi:hypothetical protein BR93DRAFT_966607 [Coniochaeta sp. PMI_546]|nr:hypothetical protein BR93DRAFT_966607 [Coniochaeta sp. PMI_546]